MSMKNIFMLMAFLLVTASVHGAGNTVEYLEEQRLRESEN